MNARLALSLTAFLAACTPEPATPPAAEAPAIVAEAPAMTPAAAPAGPHRFDTLGATGSYNTPKLGGDYRGGSIGASPAYSFTAHVVELDPAGAAGNGRSRPETAPRRSSADVLAPRT